MKRLILALVVIVAATVLALLFYTFYQTPTQNVPNPMTGAALRECANIPDSPACKDQ